MMDDHPVLGPSVNVEYFAPTMLKMLGVASQPAHMPRPVFGDDETQRMLLKSLHFRHVLGTPNLVCVEIPSVSGSDHTHMDGRIVWFNQKTLRLQFFWSEPWHVLPGVEGAGRILSGVDFGYDGHIRPVFRKFFRVEDVNDEVNDETVTTRL
eukprot:Trichotokara_eunicae@DN5106_c0_g1_i3.p1